MSFKINYLFVVLCLSVQFLTVSSEGNLQCKEIASKSPYLKIKNHLFCEYDSTVRPITQTNTTINVTVFFMPKFLDFDDHANTFSLHSWLSFQWKDEHLKWNPEDFEQITEIRVKSKELWVPDFSVYNSGNMGALQSGIPATDCIVYNTGTVFCVPAVKYTTQCLGNYALWPYDKQNCTIQFGSWSHTGEELDFHFQEKGITTEHFTPHPEWNIQKFNVSKQVMKYSCCPNDTFPSIFLEINMERESRMIHGIYVTPAVALMLMTITVMWLDSRSFERVALASVTFVCNLLSIYGMHWEIPSNGTNVPHIVIYYRNSLILTAIAIILTTLLRKLQATKASAPNWISNTVSVVLSYRAAQLLLVHGKDSQILIESSGENTEDNVESMQSINNPAKDQTNWRRLALIIERTSLFAVIITYVVMLIILIPIKNEFASSKVHS